MTQHNDPVRMSAEISKAIPQKKQELLLVAINEIQQSGGFGAIELVFAHGVVQLVKVTKSYKDKR